MKLKKILNESNRDAFNRSLTREQKREIMDSVARFNDFGSKIYKTGEIGEMVEAIRNMTSGASKLALQETDDWFDGVTVKRDMKEVAKSTQLFEKAAKELSTLQQRLESVFEDIGHKLGKYYKINEIEEAMDAVGKGDDDIDNDGDSDESDEYLRNRRKAISKNIDEGKLNEISVEQGLKDVSNGKTSSIEGVKLTSVLAWDIQQWIKMSPYGKKYAKHINKGRIGSLLPILHSQGFANRIHGANLKNWQAVVKKHLKNESVSEAAPRMKVSDDQKNVEAAMKILTRIENGMKSFNQSRHSHVKGDFKKAIKALENLKFKISRHG